MSFFKNRPLVITVILIIVLFAIVIAAGDTTDIPGAQGAAGAVAAPVQQGIYSVTSAISGFFSDMFSTSDAAKENTALKEQVAELESQLREYDVIKSENERLTELLKVQDTLSEYDYITARVIGKTPGGWYLRFVVSAGESAGVKENMIALSENGLLGRVITTTAANSRIMTILDESSGVPAMVERTRDTGVVKGATDADGDPFLTMSYLPTGADIVPGDRIITSGLGGIFPKGIYIGQVAEVGTGEEYDVTVKSGADLTHVEEAVIIKQLFPEVEQ